MISFSLITEIQAPLEFVTRLFEDRSQLPHWQHGFISDEKIKDGKEGMQYKLVYRAGNRNITLTETIIRSELPAHYDVVLRMKGMKNIVQNSFSANGTNTTLWEVQHTFRFRWLMMLIGPGMKKGLEKQSEMLMQHFKAFAEREYERMRGMRDMRL